MSNIQSIKQRFGIIGNSPALENALGTAIRVAATDLTVLITGESGVGKEVFSKIIHSLSARKHNSFIAVNCGAIPEGTINSELFGHKKGAFTGATGDRKGYFETVNGGTIFLDEIGEMPLETQAFLLRVLESGEFIPVGSSETKTTDVRIVAATNVDLQEKIKAGKFREDLFYRLSTVPIQVPALRERQDDIFLLFRKFTVDFAEKYRTSPIRLDEKARLLLENYTWPGNIRELKNVAEQISVLTEERLISAEDFVRLVPTILKRNLPAVASNGHSAPMEEREIMYKFLYDMKNDLSDLKALVFELIRTNDLNVPDVKHLKQLQPGMPVVDRRSNYEDFNRRAEEPTIDINDSSPIILENTTEVREPEVVEESLSLEDMEREMIQKALKKHKNRRKDAALELGISERTLYRKIKQYKMI